jgi:creatinine amidohydrolase
MGIARAVAGHGLKRLVFVNGHGGNTPALEEAARILRTEDVFAFVYVWWRAISDLILQLIETGGSHAGEMETAMMLAVAPELVHPDRYTEAAQGAALEWGKQVHGVNVGFDTIDFSQSGATGNPAKATPEKGEKLLTAAAEQLDTFASWLAAEPEEMLRSKPHLP